MRAAWFVVFGLLRCGGPRIADANAANSDARGTDSPTDAAHSDSSLDSREAFDADNAGRDVPGDEASRNLDPPAGTPVEIRLPSAPGCVTVERVIRGTSCDSPSSHIDCFGSARCDDGVVTTFVFAPVPTPDVCDIRNYSACVRSCHPCSTRCAPDWEARAAALDRLHHAPTWYEDVDPRVLCAESPWDAGTDASMESSADVPTEPAGCLDRDRDGYADRACGGSDCNDADRGTHPGASPICAALDRNCTGRPDLPFEADHATLDRWCASNAPPELADVGTPTQCVFEGRAAPMFPAAPSPFCVSCADGFFCRCWRDRTRAWQCGTRP